ncbi:hypothetical protein, partial [uncultured Desulfovibrio sp.]|uniref:hypothetical protein n=1 Tax=uncultured Desulfovibrio sp. TaxID=167968 RepID=UPI0025EE048D
AHHPTLGGVNSTANVEDPTFHCLADVVPFFPGKVCIAHTPLNLWLDGEAKVLYHLAFSFNLEGVALAS